MKEWIRNNIFSILAIITTAIGAYATYRVDIALIKKDIEYIKKQLDYNTKVINGL